MGSGSFARAFHILSSVSRILVSSLRLVIRDLVLNFIPSSVLVPSFVRCLIYRAAGMKLRTFKIYPRCFFGGAQVSIGRGSFVSYNCFFDVAAPITIGDQCAIGNSVQFITSTHAIGGPERRAGERLTHPIHVGNGCWIGAGVVILAGVSIGDGCVIAAGALVNRTCEANGLYAGVPVRLIKSLPVENAEVDPPCARY
jgi:maltose O-acetyltransferase